RAALLLEFGAGTIAFFAIQLGDARSQGAQQLGADQALEDNIAGPVECGPIEGLSAIRLAMASVNDCALRHIAI
ncbi:MAG TPA: hypothetical protein VHY20_14625, partial [Pirellulales bacterium]|nr:hypothetical protein [Pirellulales bacterium]